MRAYEYARLGTPEVNVGREAAEDVRHKQHEITQDTGNVRYKST